MHKSIATISSPEFINLQPLDINPLMSKCEIKVLYVGQNRNGSYINKEVATEMSKTLRGAPIVGYYKPENEDFADHGEQIIIDDEGIKFNCLTKPYGFVAPDAKVWFQDFEDTDDFGNVVTRKYLMTTGYLWTGQFEEAQRVIDQGNNQSMELDEETLKGHWSMDNNSNMEFFIIDDAIFSKLCILGEDVEPCFEGARVTAPDVSTTFTKVDDNFKKTLFTMMQDLKFALEGGKNMENEEEVMETPEVETEAVVEEEAKTKEATEEVENTEEVTESEPAEATEEVEETEDTAEVEENPVDEAVNDVESNVEENAEAAEEESTEVEAETEQPAAEEFSLEDYKKLQASYADLENKYAELVEFKETVELEKKHALIDSFYMLTDEDKKDVVENIKTYSLDEIESKLSVICVRKKVNFDSEDSEKNDKNIEEENSPETTFNLPQEDEAVPAWISACIDTQNSKK